MTEIRKAVFPVGGLGTRFLPATKAMPKEMLPLVDKPLIQYAVEEAINSGIEEIIFVTGKGKTAIEDHFDRALELENSLLKRGQVDLLSKINNIVPQHCKVSYTRQSEPLGLGHAVWCARHLIEDEPFAVILADDFILSSSPCLQQMMAAYRDTGGNILAIMDVPKEHTNRYGIIASNAPRQQCMPISGMVEKPKLEDVPSNQAIIGRYILQPKIFKHLESMNIGSGGEIQLTDAIARQLKEVPCHGFRFQGQRFDCGSKAGYVKATLHIALQRPDLRDEILSELSTILDSHKDLKACA